MVATGAVLWRRKDLTGLQKVINARIIAQTATVGLMVAAMAASTIGGEEEKPRVSPCVVILSHDWTEPSAFVRVRTEH